VQARCTSWDICDVNVLVLTQGFREAISTACLSFSARANDLLEGCKHCVCKGSEESGSSIGQVMRVACWGTEVRE
jgi:hypothetical protein